jgi:hypothetical protein
VGGRRKANLGLSLEGGGAATGGSGAPDLLDSVQNVGRGAKPAQGFPTMTRKWGGRSTLLERGRVDTEDFSFIGQSLLAKESGMEHTLVESLMVSSDPEEDLAEESWPRRVGGDSGHDGSRCELEETLLAQLHACITLDDGFRCPP